MSTITVNTSDLEIIRSREALASLAGVLDAKRPTAWVQYGYKADLTFQDYLNAYERGGAGNGAVHRILELCWQQLPRIKTPGSDQVGAWEKKTSGVLAAVGAWAKLRDFDRRNMVGRYAGLIYRMADGLALDQPLVRATQLVDLIPVYEDQLKVTAWHSDKADTENYGKPKMFQYRTRHVGDTQGRPDEWADVHPTRVQILAEGSVGDMFDGVPLLRAGFNALVDLEKIAGGSGESYLKNSARTLSIEYDVNATPVTIGESGQKVDVKQAHEDQARRLNTSVDATLVTQGAKAGVLQTTVSDPTGAFNLAANLFSASVRIPFTILFGQQTGRLASDEDKADMHARCKSRQTNELTPMLAQFITRMQAAGVIDAGAFEVEWPDISAPSDAQKMETLKGMVSALKDAFGAGVQELFSVDELRAVVGYKPQDTSGLPGEGGAPQ